MSLLVDSPFNLLNKDPIVVIGKARNIKGWSDSYSDEPLQTAFIEGIPDTIGAPVRGAQTTFNLLYITWTPIEPYSFAAGGPSSIILSYNLYIN
jgi:hypothetical protein